MEKSFLNFKVCSGNISFVKAAKNAIQAANPDWNPTDPSGSMYLSRMADITATQTSPRRRRPTGMVNDNTMTGTILRLGERKQELAERAQAYEQALKQSQHLAATRRRHPPGSGSMMAASGNIPAVGASSSMWQSNAGGAAMAQTAVLGDSQGSVNPIANPAARSAEAIRSEDLAADGGVGSGLGESYVDGKGGRVYSSQHEDRDEDESMEDGGVLGLLAQIYGAKGQGPARVI